MGAAESGWTLRRRRPPSCLAICAWQGSLAVSGSVSALLECAGDILPLRLLHGRAECQACHPPSRAPPLGRWVLAAALRDPLHVAATQLSSIQQEPPFGDTISRTPSAAVAASAGKHPCHPCRELAHCPMRVPCGQSVTEEATSTLPTAHLLLESLTFETLTPLPADSVAPHVVR